MYGRLQDLIVIVIVIGMHAPNRMERSLSGCQSGKHFVRSSHPVQPLRLHWSLPCVADRSDRQYRRDSFAGTCRFAKHHSDTRPTFQVPNLLTQICTQNRIWIRSPLPGDIHEVRVCV